MVVSDDENHEDFDLDRHIDAAYAEMEANEPDAADASLAAGRYKDPPKPPKDTEESDIEEVDSPVQERPLIHQWARQRC